jgi:hypothetical protein
VTRSLFAFAGIWTTWTGTSGTVANPIVGEHRRDGFPTTDSDAVVGPIHPKAMPVTSTTAKEWHAWPRAPWREAAATAQGADDHRRERLGRGPAPHQVAITTKSSAPFDTRDRRRLAACRPRAGMGATTIIKRAPRRHDWLFLASSTAFRHRLW